MVTWNRKRAWFVVLGYLLFVWAGVYSLPFLGQVFDVSGEPDTLIGSVYILAGLLLLALLYFKFRIKNPAAYGMLAALLILFFAAFYRVEATTDRLHFIEYGLLFFLVYLAIRFSCEGMTLFGRTMLLCLLFGLLDEGIQYFVPGREASWGDIWTNIFACYLTSAMIAVAVYYRRDHVSN